MPRMIWLHGHGMGNQLDVQRRPPAQGSAFTEGDGWEMRQLRDNVQAFASQKKKRSFACLFWLQSSQPVHAHRCQHNPSHITGSVYVVRCRQSYGSSASPESWGLLGSWSHLDALARTISVSLKSWQRNVTVQTYPWLGLLGTNSCVCCTAKQAFCP